MQLSLDTHGVPLCLYNLDARTVTLSIADLLLPRLELS